MPDKPRGPIRLNPSLLKADWWEWTQRCPLRSIHKTPALRSQVHYQLHVIPLDKEKYLVDSGCEAFGAGVVYGTANWSYQARMADGSPVTWDTLYNEGSPFVHPGKVLRFELQLSMA